MTQNTNTDDYISWIYCDSLAINSISAIFTILLIMYLCFWADLQRTYTLIYHVGSFFTQGVCFVITAQMWLTCHKQYKQQFIYFRFRYTQKSSKWLGIAIYSNMTRWIALKHWNTQPQTITSPRSSLYSSKIMKLCLIPRARPGRHLRYFWLFFDYFWHTNKTK
jgi:hypothetical protein